MTKNLSITDAFRGSRYGLLWGLFWGYEEWLHLSFLSSTPFDSSMILMLAGALLVYGLAGIVLGTPLGVCIGILIRLKGIERTSIFAGGVVSTLAILWSFVWVYSRFMELWSNGTIGLIFCGIVVGAGLAGWIASQLRQDSEISIDRLRILVGIVVFQTLSYVGFRINVDFLPGFMSFSSLIANVFLVVIAVLVVYAGVRLIIFLRGNPARVTGFGTLILVGAIVVFLAVGNGIWNYFELPTTSENNVMEQSNEANPNVVLILIDALRADHLGCYGYQRNTSPAIDALASQGVMFTQTFAPASWTRASVGTLWTSLYPVEHGAASSVRPLVPEVKTMAEYLTERGYRSIAFLGNVIMQESRGDSQGFAEWYDDATLNAATWVSGIDRLGLVEVFGPLMGLMVEPKVKGYVRAEPLTTQILERMDKPLSQPFFLYAHYVDPHGPYVPIRSMRGKWSGNYNGKLQGMSPELWDKVREYDELLDLSDISYLLDLYDEEILSADNQIGRLLEGLRSRYGEEDTIIILTADHGEEFGEHGKLEHYRSLYREVTHVPLIWAGWGTKGGGRKIESMSGLVDVLPTLAESIGLDLVDKPRGVSWWKEISQPETKSPVEQERLIWGELGAFSMHGKAWWGVRSKKWTALWRQVGIAKDDPRWEKMLFDRAHDPLESINLHESVLRESSRLDIAIQNIAQGRKQVEGLVEEPDAIDPARAERLRALGYIQ